MQRRKAEPMIRNIVFDMGQVLIRWQPEYYLSQGSFSEEDKALLLKEVFRSVEWVQLDRGSISLEAGAAAMGSRLPEHLRSAVWEYGIDWYRFPMVPMPGMADLVRELKAKGYGIYLLSNCSLPLRQNYHRIPGLEVFDGVFISSEYRLLKPQHEIYEKFLAAFCLEPSLIMLTASISLRICFTFLKNCSENFSPSLDNTEER